MFTYNWYTRMIMQRSGAASYTISCSHFKSLSGFMNSVLGKCVVLALFALFFSFIMLSSFPSLIGVTEKGLCDPYLNSYSVRRDKFLEVPQIVWGLNNQKISLARAALTARLLNRTLLMPSLSASLFYKEVDLLQPIAFNKVFQLEKFNSLCSEFAHIGRYEDLLNHTKPFELQKGSGRKWTVDRDLNQLKQCKEDQIDHYEVIHIIGKNPFLWHDHWPVKDYAHIFECLHFVDEIVNEAKKVITKIRDIQHDSVDNNSLTSSDPPVTYLAVHMRIEKDWMIHCKNLEQRYNINQICSSKEEIITRVSRTSGLKRPVVVYLAVADSLLEDDSLLNGWEEGFIPFEKKKLGVWDIYQKKQYLIKSAIDYEVCVRADIFVGNSFSTFSSLVVFERTQKLIKMGIIKSCEVNSRFSSYAYNILGDGGGPRKWMTNMDDSSLHFISYGTNNISCGSPVRSV